VATETFTPVYSDVMAATNIFDKGLADFKSGKYLQGSAELAYQEWMDYLYKL
jgi:hypothetical protein